SLNNPSILWGYVLFTFHPIRKTMANIDKSISAITSVPHTKLLVLKNPSKLFAIISISLFFILLILKDISTKDKFYFSFIKKYNY
ncbi:unnamed protein product, partial [marine sediment metagenome]